MYVFIWMKCIWEFKSIFFFPPIFSPKSNVDFIFFSIKTNLLYAEVDAYGGNLRTKLENPPEENFTVQQRFDPFVYYSLAFIWHVIPPYHFALCVLHWIFCINIYDPSPFPPSHLTLYKFPFRNSNSLLCDFNEHWPRMSSRIFWCRVKLNH